MGQCHRENDEFAVEMSNKDMKFISLSHCLAPDRIFSAFHFTLIFRQRTKSAIQIPKGLFARLFMIHWKYVWFVDWDSNSESCAFYRNLAFFPGRHLMEFIWLICFIANARISKTIKEHYQNVFMFEGAHKKPSRGLWWTRDSWRAFEISLLLSH